MAVLLSCLVVCVDVFCGLVFILLFVFAALFVTVCAPAGLVSLCSTSPPAETRLTVYRRFSIYIFFSKILIFDIKTLFA